MVSKTPVQPPNCEPHAVGSCPNLSFCPPYRSLASSTTASVSISPSSTTMSYISSLPRDATRDATRALPRAHPPTPPKLPKLTAARPEHKMLVVWWRLEPPDPQAELLAAHVDRLLLHRHTTLDEEPFAPRHKAGRPEPKTAPIATEQKPPSCRARSRS
jgi:hypothetical protein